MRSFRSVSVASLTFAMLALLPLQASAAISFVRALGTNQANSGDLLSITLTSDVPVGDTIIISFAMNPRGSVGDVQCSDTRANGAITATPEAG